MDGDQQEAEEDERAIELSSLQAIFPELILDSGDPFAASISLPVNPIEPVPVVFSPLAGGAAQDSSDASNGLAKTNREVADGVVPHTVKSLSHLPPLALKVQLPNGYPAHKPPVFQLSTESSWLPQSIVDRLEKEGPKLWEAMGKDQVVYSYVDFLQQVADDAFGLAKGKGEAVQLSQDLETSLLDFDLKTRRTKFEQETFECGICLGNTLNYLDLFLFHTTYIYIAVLYQCACSVNPTCGPSSYMVVRIDIVIPIQHRWIELSRGICSNPCRDGFFRHYMLSLNVKYQQS